MNYLRIFAPALLLHLASLFCFSQPYRLASIPKRTTAEFYELEWESLGNALRPMGAQFGLSVTNDTSAIKSRMPADTKGLKNFDSLLYTSQYWGSYGLNFSLQMDTGTYKAAFHFINFPFIDTSRQRHVNIYLVKDGRISKSLNIDMTALGFNKYFTYHMEGITIDSAQSIRFDIVNNFSKSVKDNYVTLSAFEIVPEDSLFSFYQPLPVETQFITYDSKKIKPIVNRLYDLNNSIDSLINILQTMPGDTIKKLW